MQCLLSRLLAEEKKRKEKTTPFGVKLMRSQVLYQAAQSLLAEYNQALAAQLMNVSCDWLQVTLRYPSAAWHQSVTIW